MIRDLIGIPFERLGRTRRAADCLGLGLMAQEEIGRNRAVDPWQHFLAHARDWNVQIQPPGWSRRPWPVEDLAPGDMIEHEVEGIRAHVTIVAEDGYVLQTGSRQGRSYLRPIAEFLSECGGQVTAVWRVAG